jgi:energy-coupling factor transporter transmembrane protein EcfT
MLKLAGIDNPATKALIGAVLLIVGIAVHGLLLMVIGAVLAVWGIVGVAGTRLSRER